MSGRSSIEWTDATWNPVRGCSRVSEGCRNCYAERIAGRFSRPGQPFEGFAQRGARTGWHAKWTGRVELVPEHLADPLRWRKPRRVFVNSMSDLFHEGLSNDHIAAVFGVMAAAPQHTFQVLTKRPERMREWFRRIASKPTGLATIPLSPRLLCSVEAQRCLDDWRWTVGDPISWPLPNVWLGVSVEDQATADERIPLLLETPAAVRFVSYEPALGPVNFCAVPDNKALRPAAFSAKYTPLGDVDWIIAGSESGPRARPAQLDWFRSVRDQCAAAGVSFFFKQWVGDHDLREPGSTGPGIMRPTGHRRGAVVSLPVLDDRQHVEWPRP